jgi:hypothetical protein
MRSTTRVALAMMFHVACAKDLPGDADHMPEPDDTTGTTGVDDDDGDDDEADDDDGGSSTQPTTEGDDDDGDGDGDSFILEQDGGPDNNQCDIWAQDCPAGEKCMPYSSTGDGWDATKCVQIADNAGEPGDACMAEGGGAAGIDDCAKSSMCWQVDEEGMGVCIAFCDGNPNSPLCSNPDDTCSISNEGVLALCLPSCDPLIQNCNLDGGEACYWNGVTGSFICGPDASFEGGAYGEACDAMFINVCNPGLICSAATTVPDCPGSTGCCTPYCPISEGDEACPGAAGGQQCLPVYDEGQAPPGYDDVGVCAIPTD